MSNTLNWLLINSFRGKNAFLGDFNLNFLSEVRHNGWLLTLNLFSTDKNTETVYLHSKGTIEENVKEVVQLTWSSWWQLWWWSLTKKSSTFDDFLQNPFFKSSRQTIGHTCSTHQYAHILRVCRVSRDWIFILWNCTLSCFLR